MGAMNPLGDPLGAKQGRLEDYYELSVARLTLESRDPSHAGRL